MCNEFIDALSKASFTSLVLLMLAEHVAAAEPAQVIPVCSERQLLGVAPTDEEVKRHCLFGSPSIDYPFGTQSPSRDDWGFNLTLRVDEQGRVVCYSSRDELDRPLELNVQRRALLSAVWSWSYSPFVRHGVSIPAVVTEEIYQEDLPRQHLIPPTVSLEKVHITLERSGCYGYCPSYRVQLSGDGAAVYDGGEYVDVLGTHHYRIDPARVAELVESVRSKDLWSLRSHYPSGVTDSAGYEITIALGSDVYHIFDYVGYRVGMPQAVTEFEEEVDDAAESHGWIHLGRLAVDNLQKEHFPFASRVGGELLLRSIADENATGNQAILKVMSLGAPWSIRPRPDVGFRRTPGSALEEALLNQRTAIVDFLIETGALRHGDQVDQHKLDAAFQAAIRGGRLELVQRIWNAGGTVRPSLSYIDVSGDTRPIGKSAPITLLLSHESHETRQWDGLEIAKWLVAKGCDIRAHGADGRTLLHIAAAAGDAKMVRYILDQGVPASTPGEYSLPAVGATDNEEVAMMLLQGGTDISKMDDGGTQFRRYAVYKHWARVIAWLDTH